MWLIAAVTAFVTSGMASEERRARSIDLTVERPCRVGDRVSVTSKPISTDNVVQRGSSIRYDFVGVGCRATIDRMSPNNLSFRTTTGLYGQVTDRGGGVFVLQRTLAYKRDGGSYDPANALQGTTCGFGRMSYKFEAGCARIADDAGGNRLIVSNGGRSTAIVPLPARKYVGLTVGDWAHDIGGEIAIAFKDADEHSMVIVTTVVTASGSR
jgi:hypothetical protein